MELPTDCGIPNNGILTPTRDLHGPESRWHHRSSVLHERAATLALAPHSFAPVAQQHLLPLPPGVWRPQQLERPHAQSLESPQLLSWLRQCSCRYYDAARRRHHKPEVRPHKQASARLAPDVPATLATRAAHAWFKVSHSTTETLYTILAIDSKCPICSQAKRNVKMH